MKTPQITRRTFLHQASAAALALGTGAFRANANPASETPVSFFLVGDTHFLADKENPAEMDPASAKVTSGLVNQLNKLPGTTIPDAARSGTVPTPRGVIVVGDLIDSGDKNGPLAAKMQQTEWDAWAAAYGLNGNDGVLKYPVYELHGNHDSTDGKGLVIDRIKERNAKRAGLTRVSDNRLHYSWDWAGVHFVSLGIVVGAAPEVGRRRRYASMESLQFLKTDLETAVGRSGRPVVLLHHVDLARYTQPDCNPEAPYDGKEWDPCDVRAFYQCIKDYKIAGIFYGHTHARAVLRWDGGSAKAADGIPVFNVDNSSHFNSLAQAFFHVEISPREMLVREFATTNGWETGAWTPKSWSVALA